MTHFYAYNPRSATAESEPYAESSEAEIDAAVRAATAAAAAWASAGGTARAALLECLARALETSREELVSLADRETALGVQRLNGELDRTAFQLRRFASLCRAGGPFEAVDDPAVGGAPPAGHPPMRRLRVPLGTVAMYAASNFPFAFSVLGGDTASALAAGCPVVIKAHPGHPALSRRTWALAQSVLAELGLSTGLIGLVQGSSPAVGLALVRHPAIAAAAFTGSTRGGVALWKEAQARPVPIPFFGELGAINPVLVWPAAQTDELADALAASITLGCGQFCTKPGVIVLLQGADTAAFVARLGTALAQQQPHPMLTAGMREAFVAGVKRQLAHGAKTLVQEADTAQARRPFLAEVPAATFIAEPELREEVFGPSSLVVHAGGAAEAADALRALGGSLTVTLHGLTDDAEGRATLQAAMAVAGRVLFAGVPTGVAVTAAQQHGGPWPATTAPQTTSVGDAALERFLRPVCLQDAPDWVWRALPT
ncbi:MAG: aldehyde dehydrogenase (NADP(+)) [Hydrogenophaga sp.]|nr:aldehyde dehydrogenase (NADP(+)) [Hydrogenophaga sp.]